ncbi:Ribosomal RNA small subunit methyltransferase G [Roseobacter fucihabitans]|uniref:Ribosomal RNA small subunit methyltransferase G n=1 Tax=Roseobacter fucihabitans TaxID=1537242 RepID=A0ABZ2BZI0_9RHOB|nr:16S rRNA (guanine(527)-N(7))-methyltransferase RsmG [Roseobacter litoralis]MBC6963867.1 Ribosomal RNA small subunit methyltransferase G [Roseobacter litoralis]MBC6964048.1 Ribosomal RNA small subunit methyltransferase G [Roseobacter litoralis]
MNLLGEDVSRETLDKIDFYVCLLKKWNQTINLISKSSVSEINNRHIWDSAQVYDYAGHWEKWVDLGSGGGLPGIVVAILAQQAYPERHVTMIESDTRKATFLRNASRELGLETTVINARIEKVAPLECDILSARALTDLTGLLGYADRHMKRGGCALLHKGKTWEAEVNIARESWSFDVIAHKSNTNPDAAILEIRDIQIV